MLVERVGPLVTIQDAGRFGYARYGVPAGGPWDFATWARTVRAVGSDVAIEIPLIGARFVIEEDVAISLDGELVRGPVVEVAPVERAVRYLAVSGGFDVPFVMGSRCGVLVLRGELPLAHAGGLPVGDAVEADEITFVPTFDAPEGTLRALRETTFTIDPRSDRIGTRLRGAIPAPAPGLSRPIVPGAIQVPPDGHPIVIGPDGPTTGGYPVVGVLARQSRDLLARLRPGRTVKFA